MLVPESDWGSFDDPEGDLEPWARKRDDLGPGPFDPITETPAPDPARVFR